MRSLFATPLALGIAAFAFACGSEPSTAPAITPQDEHHDTPTPPYPYDDATSIVVGVQSEELTSAINTELTSVEILATVDGAALPAKTLKADQLPYELKLLAPAKKKDARVEVTVRGKGDPGMAQRDGENEQTFVTRIAKTSFVPGASQLLRMRLETRCVSEAPMLAGGAPVKLGPKCEAPTTCIAGACTSSEIATSALEAYRKDWADNPPDGCRSPSAGAPELEVGVGETAWAAPTGQIEPMGGPQGGYHVWIAVQQKNLEQYASTTKVSATQAETGTTIPVVAVRQSYAVSGSTCELPGIRLQIASFGTEVCKLLGKPLDVAVEVTDKKGGVAKKTLRIPIASTVKPFFQGQQGPCDAR